MTDDTDELAELRDDIDGIDDDIADLVGDRIDTAEEIAAVKSSQGAALVDEDREAAVKSEFADRFERQGLDAADGRALAEFLIEISLARERKREA